MPPDPPPQPRPWSWIALVVALGWAALVRVPLILNAPVHLDSDLAVDGLTLLEAVHGHGRWHYPGTPYMGTLPVLLSLPQALVSGATPVTLVSGGTGGWLLVMLAVFLLAKHVFGNETAAWSLIPLVFSSTGALWLSGRVTGGHVLTAAWHAAAFALLYASLAWGGWRWAGMFGLWCGLGLWLDSMFAVSLAGLVAAGVGGWAAAGVPRKSVVPALVFVLGFVAGIAPREIGRRVEPHDAYKEQFALVRDPALLAHHARLLASECLPRLVAGHRLPGYQSDPDPSTLGGAAPLTTRSQTSLAAVATTWIALTSFFIALVALIGVAVRPHDAAQGAVLWGLLLSAGLVVAGFVANQNIFNADNYRYLITLTVPAALGFGIALRALRSRGRGGQVCAGLLALGFAFVMTLDTARWYARLGWVDSNWLPVRKTLEDPALEWLEAHPDERTIGGGYWDVYRLSFLTGGRVRGVPFSGIFPDRFPEWSRDLPGGHPPILVIRPGPGAAYFVERARREGGQFLLRRRGVAIVSWPVAEPAAPRSQAVARPEP